MRGNAMAWERIREIGGVHLKLHSLSFSPFQQCTRGVHHVCTAEKERTKNREGKK